MKRILQLMVLVLLPYLAKADHRHSPLNGYWYNSTHHISVRLHAKRTYIKVKGLRRTFFRRWLIYRPIDYNVFKNRYGDIIILKSLHHFVFIDFRNGSRLHFIRKGFFHHHCTSACHIGYDYFEYDTYGDYGSCGHYGGWDESDEWGYPYGYDGEYGTSWYDNEYDTSWYDDDDYVYRGKKNNNHPKRQNYKKRQKSASFGGQYYVREIDEYVTLIPTQEGLKARRKNGEWVKYKRSGKDRNNYVDSKGNKYVIDSPKNIKWIGKSGEVILNLSKKKK